MRKPLALVAAALVLAGCGGMSETDQADVRLKLSLIESLELAPGSVIGGPEFDIERATRRYVMTLRAAVDKGFPKDEARRLLADLASGSATDCRPCVEMLDRERENLA